MKALLEPELEFNEDLRIVLRADGNVQFKVNEEIMVACAEVGANEEARSKVASTRGAISQLSAAWADGETVFALGIEGDNGVVATPDLQTVSAGDYPIARPLNLLTNGKPDGELESFIQFMLGEEGQQLVSKHGYLPLAVGAE